MSFITAFIPFARALPASSPHHRPKAPPQYHHSDHEDFNMSFEGLRHSDHSACYEQTCMSFFAGVGGFL